MMDVQVYKDLEALVESIADPLNKLVLKLDGIEEAVTAVQYAVENALAAGGSITVEAKPDDEAYLASSLTIQFKVGDQE